MISSGVWTVDAFVLIFFSELEAHRPRLCLLTERNSLNLLASMLIHVKLSGRWPESRQPDSETDYKWVKRQQPLACCEATDECRRGQKRWSPPPNIPLHPSINPSPSRPQCSYWPTDKRKREHSLVKNNIALLSILLTCYRLVLLFSCTLASGLGFKLGQTCCFACTKQQIVKIVSQKGHCLACGSSRSNYIPAKHKWGISASGFQAKKAASREVI